MWPSECVCQSLSFGLCACMHMCVYMCVSPFYIPPRFGLSHSAVSVCLSALRNFGASDFLLLPVPVCPCACRFAFLLACIFLSIIMPESVSELSLSVCLLSLYNVSVCLSVYQQNSLGIGIPISRKAYRAPMWQAASDHRYQHHLQSSTSLLPPSLHHRGPRSKFNKAIAYLFGN